MKEGNKQFIKAIAVLVGINVILRILAPPFDLIVLLGVITYFLWDLYKQTRF